MRTGRFFRALLPAAAALVAAPAATTTATAGFITYTHTATALPAAPGPALTLSSITGNNDGSTLTFTLTFFNPTIEGPSSGNADAVFGFINIDTDKNPATGVGGTALDAGPESGFGRFPPGFQGTDLYVNLSSEGDPTHGAPGLVDLVTTKGFAPLMTVPVTYASQKGTTPSTMSLSIPLSFFTANGITLNDTGNFSVVVGNINNATDYLPTAVPEPGSVILLAAGAGLLLLRAARPLARREA